MLHQDGLYGNLGYLNHQILKDMKHITLIIAGLLAFTSVQSQEIDTVFYGINGRITGSKDKALKYKTIKRKGGGKTKITTHKKGLDGWIETRVEKAGKGKEGVQLVWYREGTLFSKNFRRELKQISPDSYYFREYKGERILRTGNARDADLLSLDGEVKVYYKNGYTASVSQYDRNILLSNQNWNPDSTAYINNIFYSADKPPFYPYGDAYINKFMLNRIAEEKFPVHEINDDILIGCVIMETGELSGVRILKGKVPSVNEFFRETMEMLPGNWEPAMLNDEKVRYFITMPVSLKNDTPTLKYLELTPGGQLFWNQ